MSVAAKIGSALNGEMSAFEELQQLTQTTNRKRLLRKHSAGVFFRLNRKGPKRSFCFLRQKSVRSAENLAKIFITSFEPIQGAICNHCISESIDAPMANNDAICVFCNSNFFLSKRIVQHKGYDIVPLVKISPSSWSNETSIYFGR